MPHWCIWLIAFFVLLVVEFLTTGIFTVLLAVAALASLVISLFTNNILIQLFTFSVVSFLAVIFVRPFLQKYLNINQEVRPSTNDALIGKTGVVITSIKPGEYGLVKVEGEEWTAAAGEEIMGGEKISVVRIEGVKLIVNKF